MMKREMKRVSERSTDDRTGPVEESKGSSKQPEIQSMKRLSEGTKKTTSYEGVSLGVERLDGTGFYQN